MPGLRLFLLLSHANQIAQLVLCGQASVCFLTLQFGDLRLLLILIDARFLRLSDDITLTLLVDFDLLGLAFLEQILVLGQILLLLLNCFTQLDRLHVSLDNLTLEVKYLLLPTEALLKCLL